MAYAITKGGSDWKTIKVRDVEAKKDLEDVLIWVKFTGVSWTKDNRGFFYSRFQVPASFENRDPS